MTPCIVTGTSLEGNKGYMLIVNFECGTCNFKFIRECPNGIIDFACPACNDEKVKNGKYDKRSKEYLR